MSPSNPLLAVTDPIAFERVRPDHVQPAVQALLEDARSRVEAIGSDAAPPTYASTLDALEEAIQPLNVAMGIVGHLEGVATTPALREAYNVVQPVVSEFFSGLVLDEKLYARLKAFTTTAEARALSPTRKRFLEKTMADFRRHGAELDTAGKARLRAIDVELAKLTLRISQNVLDATNAFEIVVTDEKRLSGLPGSARAAARQSAQEKGRAGWRFTLQAPSYLAVVTYADDATLREQVWRAYNTRATSGEHDNRPLLRSILRLRHEKARLLGFTTFADLVLDDRMAKRGETARTFIERLRQKTQPFFEDENRALVAFRKQLEGEGAPPLSPWDVAYYAERQRRALYDFDEEAVRPYFSADAALRGLFDVAKHLYGVRIEPWAEGQARTWHETVRPFRVLDAAGTWLGSFYVDIYPRESKRDGAWMDGIVTGVVQSGHRSRHVEVLAANVTPPLGQGPSLLTHREVETLFHEFGHLMHHVLSEVEVRSLAGCNVAWDFVELPSMIMENWAWEPSILDRFAHHHATGEGIPKALVDKMRRARNFRAANAMMRQLGFAALDLDLHVRWASATADGDADPVRFARDVFAAYAPAALPEDYAMVASFGHLFASPVGYASGYYSYKWAEVLDADAFSRFAREGLLSEAVGRAFRDEILSRGDSRDPMDLFKAFMGRSPDESALLVRSGLIPTQA
jgi:oligopeptidase A